MINWSGEPIPGGEMSDVMASKKNSGPALTDEEIAEAMGLSKTTNESEWRAARAGVNVKLSC